MSIWFNKNLSVHDFGQWGKNTLAEHLDMKFIELGDNYLKATMPVNTTTQQPYGLLHGGASVALAGAAVNQRIAERRFVSRIFPNQTVLNNRRIETFDVVAFVDEPTPPTLFYIIGEFHAERAVIPTAAKSAINVGGGKYESATF